jgi:hypothetical protein
MNKIDTIETLINGLSKEEKEQLIERVKPDVSLNDCKNDNFAKFISNSWETNNILAIEDKNQILIRTKDTKFYISRISKDTNYFCLSLIKKVPEMYKALIKIRNWYNVNGQGETPKCFSEIYSLLKELE